MSDRRADSRGTLLYSDLEAFAKWATESGYRREPTPEAADHEVLRLRPVDGGALALFYRRDGWRRPSGAKHVTTTKIGTELARRWREEQKRRDMNERGGEGCRSRGSSNA
jgi:hypothetical protein